MSDLVYHAQSSSCYHVCQGCADIGLPREFYGSSWQNLLKHGRDTARRTVCHGCEDGHGQYWRVNCIAYWEHVGKEHVCTRCELHLTTSMLRNYYFWNYRLICVARITL